jgi:uncharacterized protein
VYNSFGLTLMITQTCNLACKYCYITHKNTQMKQEIGEIAITRGINSIKKGGVLELGFFGGEPFLAAEMISSLIRYARKQTEESDIDLIISITTNGTLLNQKIWSILNEPRMHLSISLDGRPETHNSNRYFPDGSGSFYKIQKNINKLLEKNIKFSVVTVVTPQIVAHLEEEVEYLHKLGINHIELSLDLWTTWDSQALDSLKQSISRCAEFWIKGLPNYTLSWFDEKAANLTNSVIEPILCGFGKGDITVSPSGYLYPCERLVGDDSLDNPMRLKGDLFDGNDFLFGTRYELRDNSDCKECQIKDMCNTTCGCCNYVRTGKIGHPDNLLCLFNQWCLFETKRVLEKAIIKNEGESQNDR